jgi:hypothetical protein
MELLPAEMIGHIYRFLFQGKDMWYFARTNWKHYTYFKEVRLGECLKAIHKDVVWFKTLLQRNDLMVLFANMNDPISLFCFGWEPVYIPRSVYVSRMFFRKQRGDIVKKWWEKHPPDFTNIYVYEFLNAYFHYFIDSRKTVEDFKWLLNYLEDRFKPFTYTESYGEGEPTKIKTVSDLKDLLSRGIFLFETTKAI